MANETKSPTELSKEELAERRKEIKSYYEDNIPSLKVQLEYEELLRDIEKSRAERLQAQMFIAQTMAAPPGEDDMPPVSNELAQKEAAARAKGKAQAEAIKAEMKAAANTAITDNKRTLKRAK
tara:strand:+ start:284 stop:652 length:369 start_codon:yes stop_codon:yes gene_type:complete